MFRRTGMEPRAPFPPCGQFKSVWSLGHLSPPQGTAGRGWRMGPWRRADPPPRGHILALCAEGPPAAHPVCVGPSLRGGGGGVRGWLPSFGPRGRCTRPPPSATAAARASPPPSARPPSDPPAPAAAIHPPPSPSEVFAPLPSSPRPQRPGGGRRTIPTPPPTHPLPLAPMRFAENRRPGLLDRNRGCVPDVSFQMQNALFFAVPASFIPEADVHDDGSWAHLT